MPDRVCGHLPQMEGRPEPDLEEENGFLQGGA